MVATVEQYDALNQEAQMLLDGEMAYNGSDALRKVARRYVCIAESDPSDVGGGYCEVYRLSDGQMVNLCLVSSVGTATEILPGDGITRYGIGFNDQLDWWYDLS